MNDCEIFALLRDDIANRQANVDRLIADGYSVETITEVLDYIENT